MTVGKKRRKPRKTKKRKRYVNKAVDKIVRVRYDSNSEAVMIGYFCSVFGPSDKKSMTFTLAKLGIVSTSRTSNNKKRKNTKTRSLRFDYIVRDVLKRPNVLHRVATAVQQTFPGLSIKQIIKFLKSLKVTLTIEVDGRQHYEVVGAFGVHALQAQKENDRIKDTHAKQNDYIHQRILNFDMDKPNARTTHRSNWIPRAKKTEKVIWAHLFYRGRVFVWWCLEQKKKGVGRIAIPRWRQIEEAFKTSR